MERNSSKDFENGKVEIRKSKCMLNLGEDVMEYLLPTFRISSSSWVKKWESGQLSRYSH